jgi:hypothetical protein
MQSHWPPCISLLKSFKLCHMKLVKKRATKTVVCSTLLFCWIANYWPERVKISSTVGINLKVASFPNLAYFDFSASCRVHNMPRGAYIQHDAAYDMFTVSSWPPNNQCSSDIVFKKRRNSNIYCDSHYKHRRHTLRTHNATHQNTHLPVKHTRHINHQFATNLNGKFVICYLFFNGWIAKRKSIAWLDGANAMMPPVLNGVTTRMLQQQLKTISYFLTKFWLLESSSWLMMNPGSVKDGDFGNFPQEHGQRQWQWL